MRTRTWPVLGVALAALWLFVRGVEPTVNAVVGGFLFGLVVGMPVAFVFRRLYPDRIDLGRALRAIPSAVLYVLVFSWEVVLANVDVAYRVLTPGRTIEPEVILVPLRVRTEFGVTTIANSITITPGTVTLDHDEEENALYVHLIDVGNIEDTVSAIRTWEDYALEIFDEPLDPSDPAPEIVIEPGDRDG